MQKMTCSAVQIDQIPLHFESRHATLFMQAPAALASVSAAVPPPPPPPSRHRRRRQQPHQLAEARLENQTAKKKKKPEHRVEKLHPRMCVCARLHQSATHCCRRSLRCVPPPRLLLLGVRGHLIDFSPQN